MAWEVGGGGGGGGGGEGGLPGRAQATACWLLSKVCSALLLHPSPMVKVKLVICPIRLSPALITKNIEHQAHCTYCTMDH